MFTGSNSSTSRDTESGNDVVFYRWAIYNQSINAYNQTRSRGVSKHQVYDGGIMWKRISTLNKVNFGFIPISLLLDNFNLHGMIAI